MKRLRAHLPQGILAVAATFAISANASTVTSDDRDINDPFEGRLVVVDVEEIYVPHGFDNNDEIMAVLDGNLPNGCYKLAQNEVKQIPETGEWRIVQYARQYQHPCLQAQVPFTSQARLGTLDKGTHTVKAKGTAPENFFVKEASNTGPDDHLYAPVDAARVEKTDDGGQVAVIEGRFTNTCMEIVDVIVTDSGKTKEVMPVMEMVEDEVPCEEKTVPFQKRIAEQFPQEGPGRYLLHVRSLNGKAVNTMYSVYE